MGRGMLLAVSAAVVVGSVGGGLAALYSSPEAPSTPPPLAPPVVEHPAPPKPLVAPTSAVAPRPDPKARLAMQMKIVLSRFVTWSRDHAGAPCPDGAALGGVVLDPWDHPIELTCTDQPGDQIMGAISAGPDGIAGNADDVMSWTLGPEVTDLVRGPRWKSTPAVTAAPAPTATPAPTAPSATTQAPAPKRKSERSGAHGPTIPSPSAGPPSAKPPKPSALPGDAGMDDIPARR
jgi:hypothetical protein